MLSRRPGQSLAAPSLGAADSDIYSMHIIYSFSAQAFFKVKYILI